MAEATDPTAQKARVAKLENDESRAVGRGRMRRSGARRRGHTPPLPRASARDAYAAIPSDIRDAMNDPSTTSEAYVGAQYDGAWRRARVLRANTALGPSAQLRARVLRANTALGPSAQLRARVLRANTALGPSAQLRARVLRANTALGPSAQLRARVLLREHACRP